MTGTQTYVRLYPLVRYKRVRYDSDALTHAYDIVGGCFWADILMIVERVLLPLFKIYTNLRQSHSLFF